MADPIVHITAGIPDLGTGNITTLGLTIPPAGTSTSSVQGGPMAQGAVTTAAPTYTNGQVDPLSLTTTGLLRVDGSGVTQPISGTITATISGTPTVAQGSPPWTVKPDGTAWAMTSTSANVNVTNTVPVTGTFWQTTQPVSGTVTSNQGGAPWTVKPDGTAWTMTSTSANVNVSNASIPVTGTFWQTTQPVSGTVTANQGGAPWSENITQFGGVNLSTGVGASGTGIPRVTVANDSNVLATQSGTWTVQPGNTANTTPWLTTPTRTSASNGLTPSRVVAAASTNATNLKASAGSIAAIDVFNVATYTVFLKLYNKASAPTVGTDTPTWTIPIPAGGGFSRDFLYGEYFSTGISYAITKLQPDSDPTAVAANDVTGRIAWV